MESGIRACKSEHIALEAFLSQSGILWAQAIGVTTRMLSTQTPTNPCSSTSLPDSCLGLGENLRTFVTRLVNLRDGIISMWIHASAGHATGIAHRCFAWCS